MATAMGRATTGAVAIMLRPCGYGRLLTAPGRASMAAATGAVKVATTAHRAVASGVDQGAVAAGAGAKTGSSIQ